MSTFNTASFTRAAIVAAMATASTIIYKLFSTKKSAGAEMNQITLIIDGVVFDAIPRQSNNQFTPQNYPFDIPQSQWDEARRAFAVRMQSGGNNGH